MTDVDVYKLQQHRRLLCASLSPAVDLIWTGEEELSDTASSPVVHMTAQLVVNSASVQCGLYAMYAKYCIESACYTLDIFSFQQLLKGPFFSFNETDFPSSSGDFMPLAASYFAGLWVGLNVNVHIEKMCLFPRVAPQSSMSL